jgi:signal transduction histidine kinase/CheY-like chemotaxis protein
MSVDYDSEVRRIARSLSEIAHTLESAEDANERVQRALVLTRELVPYQRGALLRVTPGTGYELFAVPEPSPGERGPLRSRLIGIFRLVVDAEEIGRSSDTLPHLTLPVMGLDQVIGVLRVEPSDDTVYDARHLRLLSVVAAQLGAYLTMISLREQEARRAQELAEAYDFQQLLVGIVSHDLRNPLSVITTVASSLLRKTEDPRQAKAVERALRNAERANRIINDLLDVTHARVTGGMAVTRQRVSLRELLKEVVDDARLSNPGRAIELVAAAGDPVHGEWDPDRLAQVATNLIGNAYQYGDERTPVRVELRAGKEGAVVAVHNRGPVIPEHLLPVIFDPFRQGEQKRRRAAGAGLGLGLYIVDQIVRAHGGHVSASSTASEGTTFTVTLPRSTPAAARGDSSSSGSRSASGERADLPGEEAEAVERDPHAVVMVVDDDDDTRGGIAELLESQGYKVATASNGAEALELLRKGLRPRLILLDLIMPVMDGEALCEACHGDPALSWIPVLILSADTASAVRLTRRGASGFLPKPVRAEELLQTIERIST